MSCICGGWGIRTPEPVAQLPPFQGGALNRYANPPKSLIFIINFFTFKIKKFLLLYIT